MSTQASRGMSAATAGRIANAIIFLCAASLIMIFQPFSKLASGIGMGLVVLGGLAFNLVPMCEPGRPARDIWRAALIVVIVFVIIFLIAIGSAHLYGLYIQSTRG